MPFKRRGLLFVVSAPSGAGKTTLCQHVARIVPDLHYSISYTTRPPRPGEENGKNYYFVEEAIFNRMIMQQEFAEWAHVHGHLYGTSRLLLHEVMEKGSDVILDIDTQGARQLKEKYTDGVFIFILPPSFDILRTRLCDRKADPPNEIERRLAVAHEEICHYRSYSYLIINERQEDAIAELSAIILAERVKTVRPHLRRWVEETFLPTQGGIEYGRHHSSS